MLLPKHASPDVVLVKCVFRMCFSLSLLTRKWRRGQSSGEAWALKIWLKNKIRKNRGTFSSTSLLRWNDSILSDSTWWITFCHTEPNVLNKKNLSKNSFTHTHTHTHTVDSGSEGTVRWDDLLALAVCCWSIIDSALLMMSYMRRMNPSRSERRMKSLWIWKHTHSHTKIKSLPIQADHRIQRKNPFFKNHNYKPNGNKTKRRKEGC